MKILFSQRFLSIFDVIVWIRPPSNQPSFCSISNEKVPKEFYWWSRNFYSQTHKKCLPTNQIFLFFLQILLSHLKNPSKRYFLMVSKFLSSNLQNMFHWQMKFFCVHEIFCFRMKKVHKRAWFWCCKFFIVISLPRMSAYDKGGQIHPTPTCVKLQKAHFHSSFSKPEPKYKHIIALQNLISKISANRSHWVPNFQNHACIYVFQNLNPNISRF